jgi:hypothetical protein
MNRDAFEQGLIIASIICFLMTLLLFRAIRKVKTPSPAQYTMFAGSLLASLVCILWWLMVIYVKLSGR